MIIVYIPGIMAIALFRIYMTVKQSAVYNLLQYSKSTALSSGNEENISISLF